MDPTLTHQIYKGLEFWTLINLTDLFILLSFFVAGLVLAREYLQSYEQILSLRVSLEVWRVLVDLTIDLLLFLDILLGVIFLNPDIFADIKVALPFVPLAEVLLVPALILRVFHDGKKPGRTESAVLLLLLLAAGANLFGFTFVMEAAGSEWLDTHPQSPWATLRGLRSNLSVELSMLSFYIFYPLLVVEFGWAVVAGIRHRKKMSAGQAPQK